MSATNHKPVPLLGPIRSLIAAGVHFEGNLTFTGGLQIEGVVIGDVSCDLDSNGTVVVAETGQVTGTIKAPHIVVSGHVNGPVHASESLEIQNGGCIVGNAFYKGIDVEIGGVIEGSLKPMVAGFQDTSSTDSHVLPVQSPNGQEIRSSIANVIPNGRLWESLRRRHWLSVAALALAILVTVVLTNRRPTADVSRLGEEAAKASTAEKDTQATANRDLAGVPSSTQANLLPPQASAPVEAKNVPAAANFQKTDSRGVLLVQGFNPNRPADTLAVMSKESVVLIKKKQNDPGVGVRIELARGPMQSIPIAVNEILRVEQGRRIDIYYQGRKVEPKVIENGVWMRFVPQTAGSLGKQK